MDDAVRLMRSVFDGLRRGDAINQPRRRLILPTGSVLHSLAGAWGGYFGTKIYSTNPAGAHFHFFLYDAVSGRPLALFEANHLGQIRTGAASAYAVDLLAQDDVTTLAVIGSGFQAQTQLEAVTHVRNFRSIRIWSRDPEKRARLASAHPGAIAASSPEEAVNGADVVVTATSAKDPVIQADWVKKGALVVAMGSNQPKRRELPSELVTQAGYLVADSVEQSRIESGDFLLALDEQGWSRVVELKDAVRPARGVTAIVKSNGLGVEDVAAAAHVYEARKNYS
jgi:ornithine cyclodeaminase/alanine dehydrogenase-like protein (mu-crystallin family)